MKHGVIGEERSVSTEMPHGDTEKRQLLNPNPAGSLMGLRSQVKKLQQQQIHRIIIRQAPHWVNDRIPVRTRVRKRLEIISGVCVLPCGNGQDHTR